MTSTCRNWLALAAVSGLALGLAAPGYADDHHPVERARVVPRGEVLDGRYNHGHYYPPRGALVRTLPGGYRPYYYHGSRFYFSGGIWYAPGPYGFVVTGPPVGLYINSLPPFYTTVWFGGVPYYYADNVYYRWQPASSGYEVVDPPAGADQAPGAPPPAASASDFYIYPKNGQTKDQQSADQYECHHWSKDQTGFDPTEQAGGVPPPDTASRREQYKRAMTACLEARGYSVK
jgi:hypothetical protein